MNDAGKIGQLFFIGIPGPELDTKTEDLLRTVRPGGVCLFARNIKDARQTRDLTDAIRETVSSDIMISLDQEGGRVDRLRRIIEPMPAAAHLRDGGDAATLGSLTAKVLRVLGFNLNFAPVVDIESSGRDCSHNGLATRCLGQTADEVVEKASRYLQALNAGGIRGCLKHFPGLGASVVDSHEELPEVPVSPEEFLNVDAVPYSSHLCQEFNPAVMVAHANYPNLEEQTSDQSGRPLPSTLNPHFIKGLLRGRMGFKGLVLTDDLEMGAIIRHYGIGEASVMALAAGNDQILICNHPENILAAHAKVSESVAKGIIGPEAIANALARIYDFKSALSVPTAFDESALADFSEQIRGFKAALAG